jgi:hypothetical protein
MRWTVAAALAALVATPSLHASGRDEPIQRLEAEGVGTLTIEPDGRVSAVELPEGLQPPLRGLYEDAIKRWTFQPVEVDGRVVRALGHMDLDLYIEFRGDSLVAAGIDRVDFIDPPKPEATGLPEGVEMRAPRYPQSLAARGIGGRVLLQLETDAEGRVLRAGTREGALYARADGAEAASIRRAFGELAEASERAAKHWVMPNCGGRCTVPITYTMNPSRKPVFWQPVVTVAHVPAPWVLEGDAPPALSAGGVAPSTQLRPLMPVEDVELLRTEG